MMSTLFKQMLVSLMALLLFSSIAHSDNRGDHAQINQAAYDPQSNTIFSELFNVRPWGFVDDSGKPAGIAYDTMMEICTTAGFNCEIELVPYPRMLHGLKSGESYFATIFPGKAMQEYLYKVEEGDYLEISIIGLRNSGYLSLAQLNGKTVGVIRGTHYDEGFMNTASINRYYLETIKQGLMMLKLNRIDAIAGATIAIYYEANRMGYSKNQFSNPIVLSRRHWWLVVSKKAHNEKVTNALKKATQLFRENNRTDFLIKKYIR